MSSDAPILDSTDGVIDALGGNRPVGLLLNVSHKAVSNYRAAANGRFPGKTYLALTTALAALGLRARPSLWGMVESGPANPAFESERAA